MTQIYVDLKCGHRKNSRSMTHIRKLKDMSQKTPAEDNDSQRENMRYESKGPAENIDSKRKKAIY